jgi:hypothetical protein
MTKLVEVEREKSNWEFQWVLRQSVSDPEIQKHLITDASPQFHEFVNIVINVPNLENEGGQTHLYFIINSTWTGLPKGLQYPLGTSSQIGSLHHFIIEKILGSISKYD